MAKLVFPLRRWQNEVGETMAAEIFQVGDAMLSKMTETVRTEYHRKREVLNQSEMSVKSKNSFQEFQQSYTGADAKKMLCLRKGAQNLRPLKEKSVKESAIVVRYLLRLVYP